MESRPFARWVASGKCRTAELLALHRRGSVHGWRQSDYECWAQLMEQHRPDNRLAHNLRAWSVGQEVQR